MPRIEITPGDVAEVLDTSYPNLYKSLNIDDLAIDIFNLARVCNMLNRTPKQIFLGPSSIHFSYPDWMEKVLTASEEDWSYIPTPPGYSIHRDGDVISVETSLPGEATYILLKQEEEAPYYSPTDGVQ